MKWEQPDYFRTPTSIDDAKGQIRKEKKYLKQAQAELADAEKADYSIGAKIALDDIAMRSAAIAHFEGWLKAQKPLSREAAAAMSNATGIFIVDKTSAPGVASPYHSDIVKAIKAGGKLPDELEDIITLKPMAVSGGKIHWIVNWARPKK